MYGLTGNKAILLTAASLLAAPGFAWAGSRHAGATSSMTGLESSTADNTYGAIIELDIGAEQNLVFRLDLHDSDRVCDKAVPQIYGQPLPIQPSGLGRGELALGNDGYRPSLQARWDRKCILENWGPEDNVVQVEVGQRVEVTVEAVDGVTIPDATFAFAIRPRDRFVPGQPVSYFIILEDPSERPNEMVSAAPFRSSSHDEAWGSPSLWSCDGVRCFFDGLADKLHKIKQHAEDIYRWRGSKQESETTDDGEKEEEDLDDKKYHVVERPTKTQQRVKTPIKASAQVKETRAPATPSTTPLGIASIPPPDKSLVMTLVLAIMAFTMFSLSSICLIHMRYTPDIQRRPRHLETSEERQARVESRKETARAVFRRLFCGLFAFNEKEESAAPQGRDLRNETRDSDSDDDNSSTTMEQELAGFREAASMVSNLIAAEEGRHRMLQRDQPEAHPSPQPLSVPPPRPSLLSRQPRQPPTLPDPIRAMYPGYSTDEPPPPSYETDSAEASMVSDGFRYSPTQFNFNVQYTPSTSPEAVSPRGNEGSDRLGYGNKD